MGVFVNWVILLVFSTVFCGFCAAHYGNSGRFKNKVNGPIPDTPSTRGEPWPKPQIQEYYNGSYLIVRPGVFRFEITGHTCDILEQALKRYYSMIFFSGGLNLETVKNLGAKYSGAKSNRTWKNDKDFLGYLDTMYIRLHAPCEKWPHEHMSEQYNIWINPKLIAEGKSYITSRSIWGILRGLETFSQLLYPTSDLTLLKLNATLISDWPRFPYRSVLLDTSRHFLPKRIIFQNLDLMAMNKFNVFHWHIVDDESFPFEMETFRELSKKGAYNPYTHVYTRFDAQEIIEYARVRGIRVVPEFDTPGHTQSWGLSQPNLLTQCYRNTTGMPIPDGTFGPIDPTNNSTFDFLQKFFAEVVETFPDKYLHLGGDEVDSSCWKSNPNIREFMKMMNFSEDYTRLEDYYIHRLIDMVRSFPQKKSYIVWQEVFDNKVNLDPNTIVHVWQMRDMAQELFNVTDKGYRILLSACWYLDYTTYTVDWKTYYHCDPQAFNGTAEQNKLVMGGGPAMWGELVDATNVIQELWPRASAPAERLWSNPKVNNTREAMPRLEEHRCRLLRRGFDVQPINGPGFCPTDWK